MWNRFLALALKRSHVENGAYVPLLGYPTVWGQKKAEVIDILGPTYYVTGGVSYSAQAFNWGAFDAVFGGISESGTYRMEAKFAGRGSQTLVYFVFSLVSNGNEVSYATDLSAEIFRVTFVGV